VTTLARTEPFLVFLLVVVGGAAFIALTLGAIAMLRRDRSIDPERPRDYETEGIVEDSDIDEMIEEVNVRRRRKGKEDLSTESLDAGFAGAPRRKPPEPRGAGDD
jgi:hypothetical protein